MSASFNYCRNIEANILSVDATANFSPFLNLKINVFFSQKPQLYQPKNYFCTYVRNTTFPFAFYDKFAIILLEIFPQENSAITHLASLRKKMPVASA